MNERPAGLIAERVLANDVADYIRFRSVCQPWRRCCAAPPADDALDRRFHPRQWLILPEKPRIRYHCRLLNLSTGECILAHLPEFRGHRVFSPSTEGLVLLLHESTHVARLLNPLTHQLTDLPPVTTLLDLLLPLCDLSVDGFGLADDRTVVIHNTVFLAVAKPGDKCWTAVNLSDCLRPSMSLAGRFYGVTSDAIMVVEVSRESQTPQLVEAADLTLQHRFSRMLGSAHLVDNNIGELLLVHRTLSGNKRLTRRTGWIWMGGRRCLSVVSVVGPCSSAMTARYPCPLLHSPRSLVTPSTRASTVGIELAWSTSKPITWQMEPLNTHAMKTPARNGNTL
uniref:KIB1-4 beta-propeller domain-containing protein n=1 Tax=Oryza rufipogon TaxID=4529 RepID=A0A0E0QAA2_ORYRU